MKKTPYVSVIMPVYNAEQYLPEAIRSILDQTFTDFEFIIINDGSTDRSEEIIVSYKDPRIRYIKNERNLGLSPTLNVGLLEAHGNYIARMDSDDVSFPERLEKQVQFLEAHPDYGVVGSMYVILDQQRQPYEMGGMDYRYDEEIKIALFSNNVFVHGETMFRRDLIVKNNLSYNTLYNPCEDYELWTRLADKTKFYILEDILYSYMINPDSMSGTRWHEMIRMIMFIAREYQQRKGVPTIPFHMFRFFYTEGKQKFDGKVLYQGRYIQQFHQLNYQEFLFRTAFVYLKLLHWQGFLFLAVSFFINPLNWFKKVYLMISRPHLRLKKKTVTLSVPI